MKSTGASVRRRAPSGGGVPLTAGLCLWQSNTVLHVDLVTGAVRRLVLSADSDPPSTRASNWWSRNEQQVRGGRLGGYTSS